MVMKYFLLEFKEYSIYQLYGVFELICLKI